MIALDAATILGPKLNRYLATSALLTLGEDKVIANAVRDLTPKVTALPESFSGRVLPTSLSDDHAAPLHEHGSAAVDDHGADCSAVLIDPTRRSTAVSDGETVNGP